MRRIDELFTAWPFLGSRRMTAMLRAEGVFVNRKRVQRLMRLMGITALGPKPRPASPRRPQDLSLSPAQSDDEARGTSGLPDISLYSDRARLSLSRGDHRLGIACGLAWRLSNTMDVSFCLAALEEALAKFGKPEIFNTDQGSQFTSAAFTGALAEAGVAISMDGRGRWMDNEFH